MSCEQGVLSGGTETLLQGLQMELLCAPWLWPCSWYSGMVQQALVGGWEENTTG